VDGTRDHVTYQKLVKRLRYGFVRCAVGIWPWHQRDDTVTAWAGLDAQRDTSPPSALFSFSLQRNVYKRTKPLLAAGSRNKLGNPRSNARRILLRREARDESSARNPVSCSHLQRYGVTVRGNVTSVGPPLQSFCPILDFACSLPNYRVFSFLFDQQVPAW